jgi:23S rRNA (guanosine2251-2'-O)-methyltransferase
MAHPPRNPGILVGIHPVREALLAHRAIDRVLMAKGSGGARLQEIVDLCRTLAIPVRFEPREALDRASNKANHQGIVAFAAVHQYASLDQLSPDAQFVVILDGVEDPHNLGAIVRTAHAAGADAVLFPERRAAGLTETVAKAACGALEYLPVIRIGNVTQTLEILKARRFWTYGLDQRADQEYTAVDYARPTAFILGGEGHGLHQNVRAHCDFLLRIPMVGSISSLNVSVAAGIVLFDWRSKNRALPHSIDVKRTPG